MSYSLVYWLDIAKTCPSWSQPNRLKRDLQEKVKNKSPGTAKAWISRLLLLLHTKSSSIFGSVAIYICISWSISCICIFVSLGVIILKYYLIPYVH